MKSKTLIEKQLKKKTNSDLVETVVAAKKAKAWFRIAEILSGSRRQRFDINLKDLEEGTKAGDVIVVPGKVLSQGNVSKKIKVIALGFSETAKEKLLSAKCDVVYILDEIKKNPEAKDVKILEIKK
jgi:large subunit ribosomal protein L18e